MATESLGLNLAQLLPNKGSRLNRTPASVVAEFIVCERGVSPLGLAVLKSS